MRWCVMVVAIALTLAACSKDDDDEPALRPEVSEADETPSRRFESDKLARGERLFQQHCAQCHGPEAQGHPNWGAPPDAVGDLVVAPPLDGTGNDWKRERRELVGAITEGVKRNGEPVMPSWKTRLSDEEVDAIITWFQALWPPDVYDKWRSANETSRPAG